MLAPWVNRSALIPILTITKGQCLRHLQKAVPAKRWSCCSETNVVPTTDVKNLLADFQELQVLIVCCPVKVRIPMDCKDCIRPTAEANGTRLLMLTRPSGPLAGTCGKLNSLQGAVALLQNTALSTGRWTCRCKSSQVSVERRRN